MIRSESTPVGSRRTFAEAAALEEARRRQDERQRRNELPYGHRETGDDSGLYRPVVMVRGWKH